jgi:putative restriction endonuclease
LPHIKHAELIRGIVYMPSPLSFNHSRSDSLAALWLGYYAAKTPGCQAGSNGTWLMLEDSPQPDVYLRIVDECGGQSGVKGKYPEGASELIVETCVSRTAYDLGPKLDLYREAGVQEYITVLLEESKLQWRRLASGVYVMLDTPSDGIVRSTVFPGLWLNPAALLAGDGQRILEVADAGIATEEHAEFVTRLAGNREKLKTG